MGWTYTSRNYGESVQEFFAKEFKSDWNDGRTGRVIRCAATWTTAYLAYEIKTPAKDGQPEKREVIALVCLIHHVPRARDGFTFGYKDMDETMGPCESKCPKTILEMLTPTDSQWAKEWRERCWNRINKRSKIKVKEGDTLRFKNGIKFVDGYETDTLIFWKGNRFRSFHGAYGYYIVSNWRDMEFENLGQKQLTQP